MRRKYQVTRNRVQLQNRLEALLEEAHIKVSSVVSDLLGSLASSPSRPWRLRSARTSGTIVASTSATSVDDGTGDA
jgi:hypothetical protein